MKMRNVVLAFALTMLVSFSFTSTINANTAELPAIEDGVTGVINEINLDNGTVVFQINSTHPVNLSLISDSGQTVWNTKTRAKVITIPTETLEEGFYTLIAKVDNITEFHMVHIQNQTNQQATAASNNSDF